MKEVLEKLKNEDHLKKENITFRIDPVLCASFKKTCDAQELKYGRVIEELMRTFIKAAGR